jgi:hypothetical protein
LWNYLLKPVSKMAWRFQEVTEFILKSIETGFISEVKPTFPSHINSLDMFSVSVSRFLAQGCDGKRDGLIAIAGPGRPAEPMEGKHDWWRSTSQLLGKPGERVPEVNVADLVAVWNVGKEISSRHPGQTVGVGRQVYASVCRPGADIRAICFRLMMPHIVGMLGHEELARLDQDEPLRAAVFKVTARFPIVWVSDGPMDELPFDTEKFLRDVRIEMGKGEAEEIT